ncbi:MAG TPA: hypothetical protein VEQ61_08510 [Thermoleophilaceae bacterium]|nr:hypothetical protein [Thermoleophilaceae bacterium]
MDAATAASQTSTHGPASLPAMDAATAATPAPAPSLAAALVESANDNGFDWGDAGVGASGLMAAFLLAFGSVAYLQRRKGGPLRKAGARAAIS